jgi:hypothetical protein
MVINLKVKANEEDYIKLVKLQEVVAAQNVA